MMFLLVRHGHHEELGKRLSGRSAIGLSAVGREQADEVADFLSDQPLDALYTSPLLRTRQTAAPLAARTSLELKNDEAFHEIDFGEWTGKTFAELERDPGWKIWNEKRTSIRPPGGETICQVQDRIVRRLQTLANARGGKMIAIFSHGDVIKAAAAHWLGIPLDQLHTFDIAPGSITTLTHPCNPSGVLQLNAVPAKIAR